VTREEYARLKEIVAGALERPDAERAAYLLAACGSDAAVRREAESLLASAVQAAGCFEDPTLLVGGACLTPDVFAGAGNVTLPFTPTPLPDAALDEHFGGTARYAVRRRIGSGGMGIVYEVDDRARGQVVALKTLRRRGGDDIYQLKREFRNLADVSHPNLAALYDLVVEDGLCFLTMELVEGTTFVDYVRQAGSAKGAADRVRHALPQLVRGVQELHRRGMQHRDIKPSNVLVTPAGRVVLLDFGLTSGLLGEGPGTGIAGTPAYLSPEQCLGGPPSEAGDWYSLGAMLYHALTGRPPFEGPVHSVVARKVSEDPAPVSHLAPDTPADLADICMALVARDPAARPSGGELLRRLESGAALTTADGGRRLDTVFVGRETPLQVLGAAFAGVQSGRSASVFIYGPSGIGKSALVQHFLDERLRGETVLVLRSRCHEHESIPYKALDGLVDSITRELRELVPAELAALLPQDADALARLFPVLRVLGLDPADAAAGDPIALQRRALAAFRELLGHLARRQPVVIDIDDLHWADADSIRWLTELLRPPSPASVLTLVSFRSEELEAKPFLRSLIERVDLGERLSLPLSPLSDEEVGRLIAALLARRGEAAAAPAAEIARSSGGNPFLVDALTRHAALGSEATTGITLDEMLARRLDDLPGESRPFLEALAVCGRPALPARLYEACGFRGDERPLVARLRAAHLLRNSRTAERVEMYHDRIREALTGRMTSDAARRIHERLAEVLVAHGDDDPEALFEHYRAAGQDALAAAQAAVAAGRASDVLAFDLAATFYRGALSLDPAAAERSEWSAHLARALENAGRPVESAEAYLAAAQVAGRAAPLEWRRKAAELLLVGGQIDRGLAVSEQVLRAVGMRLARGPRSAVASLVLRRLQLRWRGLDFTARDVSQIPPEELLRIDAGWSVSAGLAMVDPIRAAAFNVRQLLWALEVGDPLRVARALALEAGFSVVGAAGSRRSAEFSRRADALAARVDQPYVTALTSLWAGIAAFLTGRWKEAELLCGRAVTTLQDQCKGVVWELNMARNFYLGGVLAQGELREVAHRLPGLLQAARERGNFYLELELSTRMILAWLTSDEPDEAARRADEGIARWSQQGFQRQHYNHLLTRVQTDLYCGRAQHAWRLIESRERAIRQSLFLRVQHTRIEAANYHARCALAAAADSRDGRRLRAIAARDAARILREDMPWSNPFGHLLQATLAFQEGDVQEATSGLDAAAVGFAAADMHLYTAVCRRRLGALIKGEEGASLVASAERWMAQQEIRNPAAMTYLIAPGFAD
jgi:hypothetical protein